MSSFVSPLVRLRQRWDARAEEDVFAAAHPATAGDRDAFWQSGAALAAEVAQPLLDGRAEPAVLDLGCGPGRLLAPLRGDGRVLHGVDISPRMIEAARRELGDDGAIGWHVGDGLTLRCVRRVRFDLVMLIDVIEELPDLAMRRYLLRQAAAVVQPTGWLWFTLAAEGEAAADLQSLIATCGIAIERTTQRGDQLSVFAQRPQTAGTDRPAK